MSSTAAQHNVNMFKYQMAKELETCKQCKATQSRNCDWQWNSNLLTEMDGSGQQHRARIHDYNGCIYWFSPIVSNSVNEILTGILTLQKTAKHSLTRMMSPPLTVETLCSPSPPPQGSLGIPSRPLSPMDTSTLSLITVETQRAICSQQTSVLSMNPPIKLHYYHLR